MTGAPETQDFAIRFRWVAVIVVSAAVIVMAGFLIGVLVALWWGS